MAISFLETDDIVRATRAPGGNVEKYWPHLVEALDAQGINTGLVQVGMAATVAIETGSFRPVREVLTKNANSPLYKVQQRYAPSGFFGRGFIQLTHERNYRAASEALGIDLVSDPDVVLEAHISSLTAAWFFRVNKVDVACQREDWERVRRIVNGPKYYLDQRTLKRMLDICRNLKESLNV